MLWSYLHWPGAAWGNPARIVALARHDGPRAPQRSRASHPGAPGDPRLRLGGLVHRFLLPDAAVLPPETDPGRARPGQGGPDALDRRGRGHDRGRRPAL